MRVFSTAAGSQSPSPCGFGIPNSETLGSQYHSLRQFRTCPARTQEADEPNALVDFLDSRPLAGEDRRDVDPLAMQAEPSAGGDEDVVLVKRVGQPRQAVIAAR